MNTKPIDETILGPIELSIRQKIEDLSRAVAGAMYEPMRPPLASGFGTDGNKFRQWDEDRERFAKEVEEILIGAITRARTQETDGLR